MIFFEIAVKVNGDSLYGASVHDRVIIKQIGDNITEIKLGDYEPSRYSTEHIVFIRVNGKELGS